MNSKQESEEKIFADNLLKLLMDSTVAKGANADQKYIDFFKAAAPTESKFYSFCFRWLFDVRKVIYFHSDFRFTRIKRKQLSGIGIDLYAMKNEFYGMTHNVAQFGLGHYLLECSVEDWFFDEHASDVKRIFVTTDKTKEKEILKFKLLGKELKKAGFEKGLCENLEDALIEVYDFADIYVENYAGFLKAKRIPALHQRFRELNYAMTCLIGCTSRWYPLFKHITYDKRYMLGFKD